MEKVKEFLLNVYHNYMSYVALGIVALAVITVLIIIFVRIQSSKIKNKKFDNNDQSAVTSLTPEEIDNISNNVSNPNELLEYINETNEKAVAKKKKSTKKAKQPIKK